MSVKRFVWEIVRRFKKGERIEDLVKKHSLLFDEKYDERLDERYLVSLLKTGHLVDVVYSYKKRYLPVFVGEVDGQTASKLASLRFVGTREFGSRELGFRERASVRR